MEHDSTGPEDAACIDPMPIHALDELIGPFHDGAHIARRLCISEDTITELVRHNEVLACPTAEGMLVFPTFQLTADDTLLPGLGRIVAMMTQGTADMWQIAMWMRTASEELSGCTPHEALQQGRHDAVECLANQTAARWRPH
ncbi:hypothetical protein [Mycolicibacterium sp. CBMA 226]|uniref:hypothetical protein n=1 Tax=Mycolicibacterium sp. CBMA 226 TaxID=2606611 RepID=UPI0012DBFE47|nr:hypothetical protein [Mycolicibacterium sp. CBMA 226]MUL74493.1 hypothetical protein [Mycolicibacterium sp. CBMA 226]